MKRLIFILLMILTFCGCDAEETVKYDLAICDSNMTEFYEYLSEFSEENYKVEKIEFSEDVFDSFISNLNENSKGLNSITLYSKNINDSFAKKIIDFVDDKQLPVTFAFSNINNEVLKSYDKAFCITTNYAHAAEMTAERIKKLWNDKSIVDEDDNKIFTFASIKKQELSPEMQTFSDTLIAGIELYGIPMQINSDITPDTVTSGDSIVQLNKSNEALIITDSATNDYIKEYLPSGSGIELITISEGVSNKLADANFVLNCFINYSDYKVAADEIIQNFNNRQYPLIKNSFPVFDRTVFIPATI